MNKAEARDRYHDAIGMLERDGSISPAQRRHLATIVRNYVRALENETNDRGDALKSIARGATKPAARGREVMAHILGGPGLVRINVRPYDAAWLEELCDRFRKHSGAGRASEAPRLILRPDTDRLAEGAHGGDDGMLPFLLFSVNSEEEHEIMARDGDIALIDPMTHWYSERAAVFTWLEMRGGDRPNPIEPLARAPASPSAREPAPERERKKSCGGPKAFRTGEDYRDHLPCEECEPSSRKPIEPLDFRTPQPPAPEPPAVPPPFEVRCDETNNTREDILAGKCRVDISMPLQHALSLACQNDPLLAKFEALPITERKDTLERRLRRERGLLEMLADWKVPKGHPLRYNIAAEVKRLDTSDDVRALLAETNAMIDVWRRELASGRSDAGVLEAIAPAVNRIIGIVEVKK